MMAKFRLFGSKTDEVSDRELVNRRLARTVAAEGMVLLKNDGVLPLQSKRLALFGAGARMTVKGGTGSGNMQERYSVSIEEGLKNAGFVIASTRWLDRFDASYAAEKETWRLGIEHYDHPGIRNLHYEKKYFPADARILPRPARQKSRYRCP